MAVTLSEAGIGVGIHTSSYARCSCSVKLLLAAQAVRMQAKISLHADKHIEE